MNDNAIVMMRLRDSLSHVEFASSLDDRLNELALMAGEMLNAGCEVAMLSERQVAEMGLRPGTAFGDVSEGQRSGNLASTYEHDAYAVTVPDSGVDNEISLAEAEPADRPWRRMFSALVLDGKVIGVMRAYEPQQRPYFSSEDLRVFAILTAVVTKSIHVIQLQNILNSRFAQMALTRSSEKTIGEIVVGSAQNPNQIARILAKSFYREMSRAGFNFNQIIYAASEVISELSNNVRKHSNANKKRVSKSDSPDEVAIQPGHSDAM